MDNALKILSLGAGVQSSTIFMMACYDEIERFDYAIFADTGWEPGPVYEWLRFLRKQALKYGLPIHIVSQGNLRNDALVSHQVRGLKKDGVRWASMPLFIKGPNGERGMIRRQCSYEYKIRPIERKQRELAGYKPRKRMPPGTIESWVGISTDEANRAKVSDKKWLSFYYPLIEMRMSRSHCTAWFKKRGLEEPPRSACIGCPFRRNKEWRWLKDNSPADFEDAVYVDKSIRKCGGMRGDVFLHEYRIPLDEVDLRTGEEKGQRSLFSDECMGVCGV